ncbi:hypothetical protein [Pseudoduganella violaceinigra]|uniref:hypothetical protein n=1 Tax=Pseudoduganella violaceinigra TaxID=246602 RepID=UPI0012B606C6|nr:hypothetical protein [Pseudoduganella violaceinigra]
MPFIGPLLLSKCLVDASQPRWTLILPWVFDIGTLCFLWVLPRLFMASWRTSRFTRLFKLIGVDGIQTVEITFHRGGHYLLKKRWNRPHGEAGIVAQGEEGSYSRQEDFLSLCSEAGRLRQLALKGAAYVGTDSGSVDDYQIEGMQLYEARN